MMSWAMDYLWGSVKASAKETAQGIAQSAEEKVAQAKAYLPELPDAKQNRLAEERRLREETAAKYKRIRQLDEAKNVVESVDEQRAFAKFKRILAWREVKAVMELMYQQSCYINQTNISHAQNTLDAVKKLKEATNWHSLIFLAKECNENQEIVKAILTTHPISAVKAKKGEKWKVDKLYKDRWDELFHEYQAGIQFVYEQKCRYSLFSKNSFTHAVTTCRRSRAIT